MDEGIRLVSVDCNRCGAPLEVADGTRFVTCKHCGTKLAVRETGSSRFTEIVEAMAENLEVIRLQNELEQLDREWLMERENHLVEARQGGRVEPSAVGGLVGLGFGAVFVLIWIGFAVKMGAPFFFPLFGVVMLAMMVFGAFRMVAKAGSLSRARADYESRRAALLSRIRRG